jgi:hypothetical protein
MIVNYLTIIYTFAPILIIYLPDPPPLKIMKIPPLFSLVLLLVLCKSVNAQVAINTTGNDPDPSAILDIDAQNKGLLIPRVLLSSEINGTSPILNPATGLLVYNTGNGGLEPGFYQWTGTHWSGLATIEQVQNVVHGPESAGIYGEIYEYKAIGSFSEIQVPSANSYTVWTSGTQGDISSMSYTSGALIIQNPGMYSVSFNAVIQLNSGGKIADAALFVNNVRQDDMHGRAWFKEGNKSQDISFSGIISFNENDNVSVGFTFNENGAIKMEMANLNLVRIN